MQCRGLSLPPLFHPRHHPPAQQRAYKNGSPSPFGPPYFPTTHSAQHQEPRRSAPFPSIPLVVPLPPAAGGPRQGLPFLQASFFDSRCVTGPYQSYQSPALFPPLPFMHCPGQQRVQNRSVCFPFCFRLPPVSLPDSLQLKVTFPSPPPPPPPLPLSSVTAQCMRRSPAAFIPLGSPPPQLPPAVRSP